MNDEPDLFAWSRLRGVYHLPTCRWAAAIAERNRREGVEPDDGRRPCKRCKPASPRPDTNESTHEKGLSP